MELSSYALEPLRHDDEVTLYRGGPISVMGTSIEQLDLDAGINDFLFAVLRVSIESLHKIPCDPAL